LAELVEALRERLAVKETRLRGSRMGSAADRIFSSVTAVLALISLLILLGFVIALVVDSMPSIRQFGLRFLVTSDWDPTNDRYGALAFIYGTAVSSAFALIVAVPLSLGGRFLAGDGVTSVMTVSVDFKPLGSSGPEPSVTSKVMEPGP